jgi:hypothetical protein
MSSKKKVFSCRQCGRSYDAYPPDDFHPMASLEKPEEADGTIIEVTHDCENDDCRNPIILYWYKEKMVLPKLV